MDYYFADGYKEDKIEVGELYPRPNEEQFKYYQ